MKEGKKVNLIEVLEILSWLKLEYKRSLWINQGRKTCLKPLQLNMQYPWSRDLCMLVEKEKLFHEYFRIKDGKFEFSDKVKEEEKIEIRKSAYDNYNPQKHT